MGSAHTRQGQRPWTAFVFLLAPQAITISLASEAHRGVMMPAALERDALNLHHALIFDAPLWPGANLRFGLAAASTAAIAACVIFDARRYKKGMGFGDKSPSGFGRQPKMFILGMGGSP